MADELPRAVSRKWMLVVAIAAVVGLVAWLTAAVQPKRYRAASIAAVAPLAASLSPADLMRGVDTLERRVVISSVAALAAAPVTKRQTDAAEDYAITAVVMPNTNLFRIEVEGPDPRRATAIANRIPAIVAVQARAIFKVYGVTLVSEAAIPVKPSLPRTGRALATGLTLGLLLGVAAAWLLDRRSLAGDR